MPPIFSIIHLAKKLIIMENQNTFIDQLLETAYPAGWSGHQKSFTRITISRIVVMNPTFEATMAAESGDCGAERNRCNRLKGSHANHDGAPVLYAI